jgi:hypothetical protein
MRLRRRRDLNADYSKNPRRTLRPFVATYLLRGHFRAVPVWRKNFCQVEGTKPLPSPSLPRGWLGRIGVGGGWDSLPGRDGAVGLWAALATLAGLVMACSMVGLTVCSSYRPFAHRVEAERQAMHGAMTKANPIGVVLEHAVAEEEADVGQVTPFRARLRGSLGSRR